MPAYDGKPPEDVCKESLMMIMEGFDTLINVSKEEYENLEGKSAKCYNFWIELHTMANLAKFHAELKSLSQHICDPPDVTGLVQAQYGDS